MNLDIVQISKRLGHSQISTTQNIYTHIFSNMEKEIAEKLESAFVPIVSPKEKPQRHKR